MDGENSNNISVLSKYRGWYVNLCFKYYNNNNNNNYNNNNNNNNYYYYYYYYYKTFIGYTKQV